MRAFKCIFLGPGDLKVGYYQGTTELFLRGKKQIKRLWLILYMTMMLNEYCCLRQTFCFSVSVSLCDILKHYNHHCLHCQIHCENSVYLL